MQLHTSVAVMGMKACCLHILKILSTSLFFHFWFDLENTFRYSGYSEIDLLCNRRWDVYMLTCKFLWVACGWERVHCLCSVIHYRIPLICLLEKQKSWWSIQHALNYSVWQINWKRWWITIFVRFLSSTAPGLWILCRLKCYTSQVNVSVVGILNTTKMLVFQYMLFFHICSWCFDNISNK